MLSILTRGAVVLRDSLLGLRGRTFIAGVSPTPNDRAPVASPRIRRAIGDLRGRASRTASGSPAKSDPGQALAYCVRPRLVTCRVRPGFDAVDVPPVTRFHVMSANPALLAFLGQATPGFHVFALSCAGLEKLWRDDLAKVLETRRPIAGRLTVLLDTGHAELEHVALPVLDAGRVVAIRGWFDQIDGTGISARQIDWAGVRDVRRLDRSRAFNLPARLLRPDAQWPESEVERQVLFAEDPGVQRRHGAQRPDRGRRVCA